MRIRDWSSDVCSSDLGSWRASCALSIPVGSMCGLRIQRPSAIADLLCLRHRRETDQAGLAGVSVRGVAVAGGDRLSYLPESPLSRQIHARFAFAVCDPLAVVRKSVV